MDQPHPRQGLRVLAASVCLAFLTTAAASGTVLVRSGDSLWSLAKRHHTTVAELQQLNGLEGRSTIYIGATLKIPVRTAPATAARVLTTHVVVLGDTLTGIAQRYGTTIAAIKAQNRSVRDGVVRLGQRLGVLVTVAGEPAPRPAQVTTNAGYQISETVQRSAAAHRATLAARQLPSRATVRALIARTAREQGLDPALALAVAYQESGFQQRVVSPVDAVGVMQVLPSTGRAMDGVAGRHLDLLEAQDNVLAGVLLLKSLSIATGSAGMTLAGYYQGLGSVGRQGLLPQTYAYIRNVSALRSEFSGQLAGR